jgi:LacI family transcriptional regulator
MYGTKKDKRMLRCSECKARFSENQGTVYYRSHISPDKVDSILQHIKAGVGIRKTGRLENVHKETVARYSKLAGKHAYKLHDELVAFSPYTRTLQFDEKWAFVDLLRNSMFKLTPLMRA